MSLTIINDTHCGAIRSGGTTPKTAWALRQFILEQFRSMLQRIDTDLLVLGDLLDAYSIPYIDLLEVYSALDRWASENSQDCTLYLVPGNHDLSKTTSTMSSFQFLCKLLWSRDNVVIIDKPARLNKHDAYVIPHCINQEQFEIELDKAPNDLKYLFLHCNFDNKFAQKADHSLNLSADRALKLPFKHIIFAHEHQRKRAMANKVHIIGNQIPSSVADCIGNDDKCYLEIDDDGDFTYTPVWKAKGSFVRVDWHELKDTPPDAQFIRVEGEAGASEANAVVSAISKLRNVHNAFVITNAVKVEGRGDVGESQSLEKAQTYDVRSAVMRRLSEAQRAAVEKLLAEHGEQS
jgi:DNA repair exonuclease SbcCD nuclease subunit